MKKNRSYFETIKRFLEPALHDKKKLILFSCVFLLWKIYEIANVYALSEIVAAIQSGNMQAFSRVLLYFLLFIFLYQAFSFLWQKHF